MNPEESNMVEELKSLMPIVSEDRRDFAQSLIQQYGKYHKLSEKQWYWVGRLIRETLTPPQPETDQVGNFSKVYAFIMKAKENNKYPKLKLAVKVEDAIEDVVLALSGPKSKNPNTVYLTDGKPYGSNRFYGWISKEGRWQKPASIDEKLSASIRGLLNALSNDPYKTITECGFLTGSCSCCNKTLIADNSVAMGMGPVCAKNWGLYEQWKLAAKKAGVMVNG